MPRFLIEVPHEANAGACVQAGEILLRTGSHFLTHADWGCQDGEHKAWIIVEMDTRDEARATIPPALWAHAKIVQLNAFTMAQVDDLRRLHNIPR
jgi:hypothetical protein